MNDTSLSCAVAAWRVALGEEFVVADSESLQAYEANVTGFARTVPCVLRPASTAEVINVVQVANEHRVPIYPVSRGRNWGLGSRLPVHNGCVVLDLSRMNRILDVDQAQQVAVVEPGVTQQQLFEYLSDRDVPLMLNVTGSSCDSSIVGNCLERGIGYLESRANSLSGLEVVLGTGEILRTGLRHYEDATTAYIHRYGLGPSLDGLFSQSNFGIVTKVGVCLLPRPECQLSAICKLASHEALGPFVDRLRTLYLDGTLRCVVRIADRLRSESMIGPLLLQAWNNGQASAPIGDARQAVQSFMRAEKFGDWSAVIGISGTERMIRTVKKELRCRLGSTANLIFLNEASLDRLERMPAVVRLLPSVQRKLRLLPGMRKMHGLFFGRPTNVAMHSLYWASELYEVFADAELQPDLHDCGFMYFLPFLPLSGSAAVQAVELTRGICAEFGCQPHTTLNVVDRQVMQAVISLSFRKSDPEQSGAAHRSMEVLRARFRDKGWYPYRTDIESIPEFVSEDDIFWQKVRDLKKVFDPNHIIAPGRYNLV